MEDYDSTIWEKWRKRLLGTTGKMSSRYFGREQLINIPSIAWVFHFSHRAKLAFSQFGINYEAAGCFIEYCKQHHNTLSTNFSVIVLLLINHSLPTIISLIKYEVWVHRRSVTRILCRSDCLRTFAFLKFSNDSGSPIVCLSKIELLFSLKSSRSFDF